MLGIRRDDYNLVSKSKALGDPEHEGKFVWKVTRFLEGLHSRCRTHGATREGEGETEEVARNYN